jgi:outer membrane lipoprotein-sorting protein
MRVFFILILLFPISKVHAQAANVLLNKVVAKMMTVKDYSANAEVTADIPMIKILPSKAKIYFKQKDKFKVEAKGIVILPKQGFTDVNSFISNSKNYQAILGDTTVVNSAKSVLTTVIPNGESSEIILAKLWIDYTRNVVMKTQITTKSNGTVTTTYTYGDKVSFGLPSKMVFEIDVKKFRLPKSVAADINNRDAKTKQDTRKKGTITVSLSNYSVNQGLSDALFAK